MCVLCECFNTGRRATHGLHRAHATRPVTAARSQPHREQLSQQRGKALPAVPPPTLASLPVRRTRQGPPAAAAAPVSLPAQPTRGPDAADPRPGTSGDAAKRIDLDALLSRFYAGVTGFTHRVPSSRCPRGPRGLAQRDGPVGSEVSNTSMKGWSS